MMIIQQIFIFVRSHFTPRVYDGYAGGGWIYYEMKVGEIHLFRSFEQPFKES